MSQKTVLRFDNVTFEYVENRPILEDVSFSIREGSKITLMGQNGAGKSTIFKLIRGVVEPKHGKIHLQDGATVGTALQSVDRADFDLTVKEYFERAYDEVPRNVDAKIAEAMDAVNFDVPTDRKVGDLSGGQQARLLLAFALLQHPDILLLDEPTNNLDAEGIAHLISFLVMYDKTVLVISHDADFLNCFSDGVLYLDVFNKVVETYNGDYFTVVEEIKQRIEREKKKNAQLRKKIADRKEKANTFSFKGGKMRKLAKKMRDETAQMEDEIVDVRSDDKTIYPFEIPNQGFVGNVVELSEVKVIIDHSPQIKHVDIVLRQDHRLLVEGPNGIGKSTLLRSLMQGTAEGAHIHPDVRIGYYSQDFASLDFSQTVIESLESVKVIGVDMQEMRRIAAGFLLKGDVMGRQVGELSDGQKGLLSFARLVLMHPGLIILDEPTNHINFRHLPVLAEGIEAYKGAIIMISHMPEFVEKIRFDQTLNLGTL